MGTHGSHSTWVLAMIDSSDFDPRDKHGRRDRNQAGRALRFVVYTTVILAAFLAGAVAKWQNWDWVVTSSIKSAFASVVETPSRLSERRDSRSATRELPAIHIQLKSKHVDKLGSLRDQAISDGFLRTTDADFVPATMTYKGEATPIKMRLKGDRLAHLVTDKWSFRVKA